jgi:hypothetical protein
MKNLSLLLSNFGYRFLFTVIGLALTNNVYACSGGFYEVLILGASLSAISAIILLLISFRVSKGKAYFIRILAIILSLPLILLILLVSYILIAVY